MTYHIGGRLGDFLQGLVVPKHIYDTTGEKANIFISDAGDKFTAGIERTLAELEPIMYQQQFVNWCHTYDGRPVDMRLYEFRNSPLLERECWTDVYFKTFLPGKEIPKNFWWMHYYTEQKDHLAINRRFCLPASTEQYMRIIKQYPADKVFFLANNEKQWKDSGLSDCTQLRLCPTLSDMFREINSCSVFLGDQSAPASIAASLGKDRIIELNRCRAFCEGETKYYDNFKWFCCGYVPYEATR